MSKKPTLGIDFCGVHFVNPFTIAASPPSDRRDRIERAFAAGWGGAVFKTTSVEGNPVDLVYPMMGALSYKNNRHSTFYNIDLISERHIDEICSDIVYLKKKYPDRILIGSIEGSNHAEWIQLVEKLEDVGVDMIECSMSCPQGDAGTGVIPVNDPDMTRKVTGWICNARRKNTPVIVKLNPIVTNLSAIAEAAKEGGADAVCTIDTVRGYAGVDLNSLEPKLSVRGQSSFCGLSGPAVKPIAMACISEIAQNVKMPIAGVGGVTTWQDAAEFLLLGASNVQVCTAIMKYGVEIIEDLTTGLLNYMEEKGFETLDDMVGRCTNQVKNNEDLDRETKIVSSIDRNLCIDCNSCYIACRDGGFNAISVNENGAWIDETKCRGCGVCQSVCPVAGCMVLKKSVKGE